MRTRALVSLLAASLAAAQPALAQNAGASGDPKEQAKVHYQNAEAAMKEGRFAGAAAEYIEAYELMKDPLLFYKIGVAYQSAGDCAKALVYFKRYIREGKPAADLEAKTNEKIAACDPNAAGTGTGTGTGTDSGTGTGTGAVTTTDSSTSTATDTATPTDSATTTDSATSSDSVGETTPALEGSSTTDPSFLDTKPSWQRSAGWVLMGGTIAFATAGTILAMSGASREEDLDSLADFRDPTGMPASYDGTVRERYEDLVDEGDRFNTWATVAFGAAGVCLVASVTLLVLDSRSGGGESGSAISRLRPVLSEHGGGVVAHWKF
jgi:hypothetical protein